MRAYGRAWLGADGDGDEVPEIRVLNAVMA
jgi:hypothetical protein